MKIYRVVPFWNNNFNIRVFYVLDSNKLSFDPNFVPIFNSAHIKSLKMF